MAEAYVVENPDPNNFIVGNVSGDRRFIFHVVPMRGSRTLQPAAWAQLHSRADYTDLHDMWSFAEREARKLHLIN